jgi:hypothetical protein
LRRGREYTAVIREQLFERHKVNPIARLVLILNHAADDFYGGHGIVRIIVDEIIKRYLRLAERAVQQHDRKRDQRRGERRAEDCYNHFQRFSRLPHFITS